MHDTARAQESRTKRLKAATRDAHEHLDRFIMRASPFADRARYGRFLKMQYLFHGDLDALFFNPALEALLPNLAARRRLLLVEEDLRDIGSSIPNATRPALFVKEQPVELAQALGWLYVIEGSNLGAAFLLKYAAEIGLGEDFGARHLAGAPQGRGLHWRTFTAALDQIGLTKDEEAKTIAAADAAFRHVANLAKEVFDA
ncbi:Heme oxygenase [Neorhizobium galegae bv. orientalis]|nr:Heme oxygenase [Neorhizobium galegae bv. orientalis]